MLTCRKRASRCPIFLFGRMPVPNDGSHSTFSSNASSVPGSRQTATFGSPTAANPRVMEFGNLVATSLSSILLRHGADYSHTSKGLLLPLGSRDVLRLNKPPQGVTCRM